LTISPKNESFFGLIVKHHEIIDFKL